MKGTVRELLLRRTVVIALVVLLVGVGVVAGVSILTKDPNPIQPAEGTLTNASDLTVDSQSLSYSGTDATAVDVVVNNTGTSDHTVDMHFRLEDNTGSKVESTTKTSITVTAGSTKTVTWTFSSSQTVNSFSKVEVTIEQTS